MTKCEYCGKEIGLMAVRYTWLDKKNNKAMHDKCYKKYKNESPEERKQISEDKMEKRKFLGMVILILAIPATIHAIYSQLVFATSSSIYNIILFLFSDFIGAELIRIKKKGLYYKLVLICGIIILALIVIGLLMTTLIVILWE